jgi:hypothetical protein
LHHGQPLQEEKHLHKNRQLFRSLITDTKLPASRSIGGVTPERAICTLQSHPTRQGLPDWPIYPQLISGP